MRRLSGRQAGLCGVFLRGCPDFASLLLILLPLYPILTGCTQAKAPKVAQGEFSAPSSPKVGARPKDLLLVNALFVAPPTFGHPDSISTSSVSPENLYSIMKRVSADELSLKLLSADSKSSGVSGTSSIETLLVSAAKAGADSILTTEIGRFHGRKGSALGASEPASVSFVLSVYKVSDGALVWSSSYDFADTSLAEDVVKFHEQLDAKGGYPSWSSADSLFEQGYRKGVRDLYERRNNQFLVR